MSKEHEVEKAEHKVIKTFETHVNAIIDQMESLWEINRQKAVDLLLQLEEMRKQQETWIHTPDLNVESAMAHLHLDQKTQIDNSDRRRLSKLRLAIIERAMKKAESVRAS